MGLPTVGSCEIAVLHSECFPVETGNSLEKFLQFPLFLTKLNFPGRLRQGSFEWVGARGRRGYDAPMLRCSGLGEEGEEEKRVNGVATAFSG